MVIRSSSHFSNISLLSNTLLVISDQLVTPGHRSWSQLLTKSVTWSHTVENISKQVPLQILLAAREIEVAPHCFQPPRSEMLFPCLLDAVTTVGEHRHLLNDRQGKVLPLFIIPAGVAETSLQHSNVL